MYLEYSKNTGPVADEVSDVYESLIGEVRRREDSIGQEFPREIDVPPIAECLTEPLQLWQTNRKPTRTVPVVAAYHPYVDDTDRLPKHLLVGLDGLVTMLDQFIDSKELTGSDKQRLAVNIAFSSLLSFSSIPEDDRAEIVDTLFTYLVETAQIPAVERAVQAELDAASSSEREMELIQFCYSYRSRDISMFGRLPAVPLDIDPEIVDRIVRDLQTYRAHFLLFDDIRDVEEDIVNNDQTPVTWLLRTFEDVEEVFDRIATVFQHFEYADSPSKRTLVELERRPEDLRSELNTAMKKIDGNPDAVSSDAESPPRPLSRGCLPDCDD